MPFCFMSIVLPELFNNSVIYNTSVHGGEGEADLTKTSCESSVRQLHTPSTQIMCQDTRLSMQDSDHEHTMA